MMIKRFLFLLLSAGFAMQVFAQTSYNVQVRNSLIKNGKNGLREIIVVVDHKGQPTQGVVTLGKHKKKIELNEGRQSVSFVIPEVKSAETYPVTVRAGGKVVGESKTELTPLKRKWQVNLVQHSHTDIGYTRPQHEILSEHIRFIDYALDYCDLTDDYPDDAKFRWTCEAAWAVNQYIYQYTPQRTGRKVEKTHTRRPYRGYGNVFQFR